MRLGDQIRAARERAGITQGELADALGKQRTTVNNWETGRSTPRSTQRIRAVLGVDEDFTPIADARPGRYEQYTVNELVTQIRQMAAELGRRLDPAHPALTNGSEAAIREVTGARRIGLPPAGDSVNRRRGVGHDQ